LLLRSSQVTVVGASVLRANSASALQPSAEKSLLFGFAAATLGITGFETSANYIEEQKPGVFPKTLRNMWLVTLVFNPLLSFLAVSILTLEDLSAEGFKEVALSKLGLVSAGRWLEFWVSLDAFLVLCGAIITSYVGVTGLIKRLAQDRWLPPLLLQQNQCRHTYHWIIAVFCATCASLVNLWCFFCFLFNPPAARGHGRESG